MIDVPLAEVLVATAVVVGGWYLWASAVRIDRLHHRLESARASLAVHLTRRAALALESAGRCDPATALILADAAAAALGAELEDAAWLGGERLAELEQAHSDLTAALVLALGDPDDAREVFGPPGQEHEDDLAAALHAACLKVQLARRFHNSAVDTARRMRSKWVVRWARLAGRAPWPRMVEMDDAVPEGLQQYLPS
ncbi:MAG: hypothetical protein U0Q15_18240 [Kineosporiaceae bacterium]